MLVPGIQRWLQHHCDSSEAVSGGVVVLLPVQPGVPDLVAEWPASGLLTPALASAAQAAVQRVRPVVVAPTVRLADSGHNRVISLPLRSADRLLGAVALAVRTDDTHSVERLFQDLEQASADVRLQLEQDAAGDRRSQSPARVLRLQAALLAEPTLADGALVLASELAALIGSERVTLGVAAPAMRVQAMSGSAEFAPQQALLRLVAAAMQEACDQGARVTYPALATDAARIILAHDALQAATGHTLLTVPLVHGGRAVGALMAEFRSGTRPAADALALCEGVAAAIGAVVALRQAAERPWRGRQADALRALWRLASGRGALLPKAALALGAGLWLAAVLVPLNHRVGAPARIEGAVQRVVAAPFDGFLHNSHVRPGDTVRAGDLLVEMADQDLVLERRKWEGALAQQENAYAAALARADRAQFVVAHGKADEARSQLELVSRQLSRTRLLAPIDGVVIEGDLSQTLGAPVQRGDALLRVAPREQYRLIALVDERDIADIRPGQSGQLALASRPLQPLALVVERVTPVAVVREGRNVFEVEARLTGAPTDLRPGLQGVAKIDAGQQSFAWIWTHRSLDALRLAWWSWGP